MGKKKEIIKPKSAFAEIFNEANEQFKKEIEQVFLKEILGDEIITPPKINPFKKQTETKKPDSFQPNPKFIQKVEYNPSNYETKHYRIETSKPGKLFKPVNLIGRNEQCPCGSGKKFKKCHLKF